MMRLALGAKCGLPSGSKDVSVSPASEEKRFGFSKDPSAAAPMPAAVRLKKWRRVRRRLFSRKGFIRKVSSIQYSVSSASSSGASVKLSGPVRSEEHTSELQSHSNIS